MTRVVLVHPIPNYPEPPYSVRVHQVTPLYSRKFQLSAYSPRENLRVLEEVLWRLRADGWEVVRQSGNRYKLEREADMLFVAAHMPTLDVQ